MANSEEYKQQAVKLLPRGMAWLFEADDKVPKLLQAFCDEMEVVDGSAQSFLEEFFPDTTTAFLPDWERVAGLPDPCSGLAVSIGVRRADLITRLTSVGGQSVAYFIALAASLGYTITITEFNPFKAGISKAGDPDYGEAWQHAWQVNGITNQVTYFKASKNAAGDPLATWGQTRLECLLNRLKPAHTVLIFVYS